MSDRQRVTSSGEEADRAGTGSRAGKHPLLDLQRLAGNAAVSGMVSQLRLGAESDAAEAAAESAADRATAPGPVPAAAGRVALGGGSGGTAVPAALSATIEASRGRGRRLDTRDRGPLQRAFGRDLGDVSVHQGRTANDLSRAMGAAAFATGSDVFLGSPVTAGPAALRSHVLAHEVAHTGQGDLTVRRFSLGDVGKWFKSLGGKKGDKGGKEGEEGESNPKGSKGPSETPTATDAEAQVSRADAVAYEASLGRFLFNSGRANYAAAKVVDSMIHALIKDFDAADEGHQKQIASAFGANPGKLEEMRASAGQVGTTFEPVWAALRSGNLRERLTAVYNAMFGAFKQYVTKVMGDSAWQEAEERGLNVTKLKRRKNQMKFNLGAKDLYRDPGNPLDRKNFSTYEHTGGTREMAGGTSTRTVGDLAGGRNAIGLSDREKAFQFPGRDGEDLSGEKLKWSEGGTRWRMRADNKWVSKVEKDLKMPLVAGPSGTMLKFMQLWEFLNKPVPAADMRAAVLGWMLTSQDHSFHEMMLTAADFGLPYAPGPRSYRSVAPFAEDELRASAAVDRTFPDEKAFARKYQRGEVITSTKAQEKMAGDINKDAGGKMTDVEVRLMQTLVTYTDEDPSAYKFMNNAFGGGLVSLKFMKFIKEDSHLKPLYAANKFNIKQLIAEAQDLSFHAANVLKSKHFKPHTGEVWRGQKGFFFGWVKPGTVLNQKKFTSTSTERNVAEGFSKKGMGNKSLLIKLNSKTGRNVDDFSLMGGENEVLFAPGSKFRIETAPKKEGAYYITQWEDVSDEAAKPEDFKPEDLKHLGAFTAPTPDMDTGPSLDEDSDEDSEDGSGAPPKAKEPDLLAFVSHFDDWGDMINVNPTWFDKIDEYGIKAHHILGMDEMTKHAFLKTVYNHADKGDADMLNSIMQNTFAGDFTDFFTADPPKPQPTAPTGSPSTTPPSGGPAPIDLSLGLTITTPQLQKLKSGELSLADVFSPEHLSKIGSGYDQVGDDMGKLMSALGIGGPQLGMMIVQALSKQAVPKPVVAGKWKVGKFNLAQLLTGPTTIKTAPSEEGPFEQDLALDPGSGMLMRLIIPPDLLNVGVGRLEHDGKVFYVQLSELPEP